jgi:hypothetical protein
MKKTVLLMGTILLVAGLAGASDWSVRIGVNLPVQEVVWWPEPAPVVTVVRPVPVPVYREVRYVTPQPLLMRERSYPPVIYREAPRRYVALPPRGIYRDNGAGEHRGWERHSRYEERGREERGSSERSPERGDGHRERR